MQQDDDLKRLEELIAGIGGADFGMRSRGACALLLEHLQAARRDLLGSMGDEYRASLDDARQSVMCIPDKNVRTNTKQVLRGLMESRGTKSKSVLLG